MVLGIIILSLFIFYVLLGGLDVAFGVYATAITSAVCGILYGAFLIARMIIL